MLGAMALFTLIFTEEFEKNFEKLKDKTTQRRMFKKILELKTSPEMGRMLVGIKNETFGHVFRLRVGKYRIIYAIKYETKEVYLITLGHREGVYDRM
jgi:mRNA-degrading endonuclease RelE of RelBE toxin-antitoxin system